jgi:2-hydroxycyclohexanecarboxyl-CoA dehydrogenase
MADLSGRVAIVTGAGRGIGRAIALRLGGAGAKVAVLDLDVAAAGEVAAAVGSGAIAVRCDVTDAASVRQAVGATEQTLGPNDILVNNAGWDKLEPFVQSSEETWDRIISINLKGVLNCVHAVLPGMIERASGRIVSIGSDAGRVGSSGEAVYAAAKGGIIAFSKTIAREVARQQINVNVVCPGPTNTPLFAELAGTNDRLMDALKRAVPFGRLAEPDEIAAAVAFLVSDDARFITGQTLSVSGGLTMA